MISHKHKFIFIHVAKTGGTSIEHVLNPNVPLDLLPTVRGTGNTRFAGKHNTALNFKIRLEGKDIFDSYFKFAFVRNPWDLEVSLYKWVQLLNGGGNAFKEWIKISRKNTMGFTRWMCDKKGNNLLDFIGKFENLQEDFDIVCDKIGIPQQQLPHKNKTKHKHYTEYYDDETREIVTEKYAKDIEYFGYRFEG